eukprot:5260819-Amphidinium_carterae.1
MAMTRVNQPLLDALAALVQQRASATENGSGHSWPGIWHVHMHTVNWWSSPVQHPQVAEAKCSQCR